MSGLVRKKLSSLEEAVAEIKSGDTVAIGGYYFCRHPMALIRAIVKAGLRDLTVVTSLSSIDADLLIAAGCVRKIIFGFISFDILGFAPNFRAKVEAGTLEAIDYADLPLMRSLEASSRELPYVVARGLTGSNLLDRHPARQIEGANGEKLLALPPIRPDVMLIHAQWSDRDGNLMLEGEGYDTELLKASRKVVATVERIVGRRELAVLNKLTVPRYSVDALVELPYGAHPCSCYPWYVHDVRHLLEYLEYSRQGKVADYIQRYVLDPSDHADYLERAGGMRRHMLLSKMMQRGIAYVREARQ